MRRNSDSKNIHSGIKEKILKIIPESPSRCAFFSCILTSLFTFTSVSIFQSYSGGVFIGIPFFVGFFFVSIFSLKSEVSFSQCASITFAAGVMTVGLLMLFFVEGIICLTIALGVTYPAMLIGGLFAMRISKALPSSAKSLNSFPIMSCFLVLSFFFEGAFLNQAVVRPVSTEILIEARPEEIWPNIISF